MTDLLMNILDSRYPHQSENGKLIRTSIKDVCKKYLDAGFGDNDAEQKLCSSDDAKFWQQLSEVLLADQLNKIGITPLHKKDSPDFLIQHEGRNIWIEVITPEPSGIPDEWTHPTSGKVGSFPHEAILLRWTAAIKEKSEKLLGFTCRKSHQPIPGYIEKGIVSANDVYVIAINSRLLRGFNGAFPELYGISQHPFAVEAVFCVGPFSVKINRDTLEIITSEHQNRSLIPKPKGAAVPANIFLNPVFAPISAIWAVDINENVFLENQAPMVVVHNPKATNPLPIELLPAQREYIAADQGDYYNLQIHKGLLSE